LSGFVYKDKNNDGVKDSLESGVANVVVTLTGTDDRGTAVSKTNTTNSSGAYQFTGLRPGTYNLTEGSVADPSCLDGKDSVGTPSLGSVAEDDLIHNISLPAATSAVDYNFGGKFCVACCCV